MADRTLHEGGQVMMGLRGPVLLSLAFALATCAMGWLGLSMDRGTVVPNDAALQGELRFVELPSSPRGMRCVGVVAADRETLVTVQCVREPAY